MLHLVQQLLLHQVDLVNQLILYFLENQPIPLIQEFHQVQGDQVVLELLSIPEDLELHHAQDHLASL